MMLNDMGTKLHSMKPHSTLTTLLTLDHANEPNHQTIFVYPLPKNKQKKMLTIDLAIFLLCV